MSEHLTYTSGGLDRELDEEFERLIAAMRVAAPAPFAHVIERSEDGEVFERHDPSGVSGYISGAHVAGAETVAEALRAARGAQGRWSRMPHSERCSHMRAVAHAIGKRHLELECAVSLETTRWLSSLRRPHPGRGAAR